MINGMCDVQVIGDPETLRLADQPTPFLRLKGLRTAEGHEVTVDVTVSLAHMIGGAAAGAAERFNLP
jgi:hypothetical protein